MSLSTLPSELFLSILEQVDYFTLSISIPLVSKNFKIIVETYHSIMRMRFRERHPLRCSKTCQHQSQQLRINPLLLILSRYDFKLASDEISTTTADSTGVVNQFIPSSPRHPSWTQFSLKRYLADNSSGVILPSFNIAYPSTFQSTKFSTENLLSPFVDRVNVNFTIALGFTNIGRCETTHPLWNWIKSSRNRTVRLREKQEADVSSTVTSREFESVTTKKDFDQDRRSPRKLSGVSVSMFFEGITQHPDKFPLKGHFMLAITSVGWKYGVDKVEYINGHQGYETMFLPEINIIIKRWQENSRLDQVIITYYIDKAIDT